MLRGAAKPRDLEALQTQALHSMAGWLPVATVSVFKVSYSSVWPGIYGEDDLELLTLPTALCSTGRAGVCHHTRVILLVSGPRAFYMLGEHSTD